MISSRTVTFILLVIITSLWKGKMEKTQLKMQEGIVFIKSPKGDQYASLNVFPNRWQLSFLLGITFVFLPMSKLNLSVKFSMFTPVYTITIQKKMHVQWHGHSGDRYLWLHISDLWMLSASHPLRPPPSLLVKLHLDLLNPAVKITWF